MNRNKIRSGIIFVIITALLAIALATTVVKVVQSYRDETEVVATTREIPPYTTISPEHVTVVKVPTSMVKDDTISTLANILGKVTRMAVLPGEQLRKGHLVEENVRASSLLTVKVSQFNDPHIRAIAVPIDTLTGLGGSQQLQPGDRVDVVATIGHGTMGLSKVVIANAPILGFITEDKTQGVILAVSVAQTEEIAFVLSTGTIRLTLNPYHNTDLAPVTPGMSIEQFVRKYGAAR